MNKVRKMHKRRSVDQLVRFVWSRNIQYDYLLLVEVQSRNPFSFRKPKPVWDDIAKALRENDLKMKVTDRSCRERVAELLKKHRQDEIDVIRSTGATADKLTELKALLTTISEMALTKPSNTQSSLYQKQNKKDGEAIRTAALNDMSGSDTDSDDYISNSSRKKSRQSSNDSSGEIQMVNSVGDFFGRQMSLQEEEEDILMNERLLHLEQSSEVIPAVLLLQQSEAGSDMPSTSISNGISIPVADTAIATTRVVETVSQIVATTPASSIVTTTVSHTSSNDRFSNPKKDLVKYLEKKSKNECQLKSEEIRVREMEAVTRKDEVAVLRMKTENEAEENKKCRELEAENKKEELRILRLRTEADIDDRKKMQDLLISLLTKNNPM